MDRMYGRTSYVLYIRVYTTREKSHTSKNKSNEYMSCSGTTIYWYTQQNKHERCDTLLSDRFKK